MLHMRLPKWGTEWTSGPHTARWLQNRTCEGFSHVAGQWHRLEAKPALLAMLALPEHKCMPSVPCRDAFYD